MSWLAECGGRLDFIYKGHIPPYKGHNFSCKGYNFSYKGHNFPTERGRSAFGLLPASKVRVCLRKPLVANGFYSRRMMYWYPFLNPSIRLLLHSTRVQIFSSMVVERVGCVSCFMSSASVLQVCSICSLTSACRSLRPADVFGAWASC